MASCGVCFRHCELQEEQTGFCKARICKNGNVVAANYGLLTSVMLDPIEKKPLSRFYPGSMILSVGSYGCNLRCPFCQNNEISWGDEVTEIVGKAVYTSPEKIAGLARELKSRGNIGVAYTYNEPLIGYEFVLDTAKLIHAEGMKNVLVTNGTAELSVLEELLPFIDAMNIDLKGFTDHYYNKVLGGNRKMVMEFIKRAVQDSHVELTTLIVPGENDSEEEMLELASWISDLRDSSGAGIGSSVPLHVSRFFPRFHMTDRHATDVAKVYRLAEIARQKLKYVYTGNC